MRVELGKKHYAIWNRSLQINFYVDDTAFTGVHINYNTVTIGGNYSVDNPPPQTYALQVLLDHFAAPDCDTVSHCPACGEPSDYCLGHGPMGDAQGYAILALHDDGVHSMCHRFSDCREV